MEEQLNIPEDKLITIDVTDENRETIWSKDVQWKDLKYCRTMSNMLADFPIDDNEKCIVPIPQANLKDPKLLDLVIEYAGFMRTPEYPREERKEDAKIDGQLTEWEKKWTSEEMDKQTLHELTLLANYLEFNFLLEPLCLAIAGMFKDKTPEEIRKEWNITNDFSKEEEEKIKKENQFIEEAQERK